jgi:hypothetical protein
MDVQVCLPRSVGWEDSVGRKSRRVTEGGRRRRRGGGGRGGIVWKVRRWGRGWPWCGGGGGAGGAGASDVGQYMLSGLTIFSVLFVSRVDPSYAST